MDDIVKEALEQRQDSLGYNNESRTNGKEDMEFELGGEYAWDNDIWKARGERPRVSIDSITTKKHALANDLRDLNPEIKIIPKKDDFEEHAKVRQEIIRDIQERSSSESIYDYCFNQVNQGLSAGFSFMQVETEYISPTSFEQQIKIKNLKNNLAVHYYFNYQNPSFIDMKWGLVEFKMTMDNYKKEYSKNGYSNFASEAFGQDQVDDAVILGEYYRIIEKPKKLLMISNGGEILEGYSDDIKILDRLQKEMNGSKVWQVIQERKSYKPQLERYILNGEEILEENKEVLGSYIPIIPYEGRSIMIEGKSHLISFIRNLKEPARLKNYAKSLEVEMLAMQPLSTWTAPREAIADHMEYWETANNKKWPVLPYEHKDKNGEPLPPPQRTPYQGPSNQMAGMFATYDKDLDDISGMYNDNVGGPSQLRSGVAIDLKQSQGNHNNFDFIDNFTTRTLNYMGIVLNDLITVVHDEEKEINFMGKGNKRESININGNTPDSVKMEDGEFEVKTIVASATESKRKASNDTLLSLLQQVPAMQNAAHLIAGNLEDFPEKDELVRIMKASLPPNVLEVIEGDPETALIENGQLKGQLEQVQAELQQAAELIKSMQIDSQTKIQVQAMKSETDINKELIKGEIQLKDQQLENEGEVIQALAKTTEFALNERATALANKAIGDLSTNQGETDD